MKNQKGVTLISLTIYIIALTVIIAVLSVISTYFYKNVNDKQDDITPLIEFTNFNSYFAADANSSSVTYLTKGEKGDNNTNNYYCYMAFVNEQNEEIIKYVYVKQDKTIYRDTQDATIPVARNVTNCIFTEGAQTSNNKTTFSISLEIGNNENKTYTYNLDND